MGQSLSEHRMGRSWVAVAAHQRNSAGSMGKRGKGRSRKDSHSRQSVRSQLRRGDF